LTILQIYRDFVKPGREADFDAVERDAARICADLGFPHRHLAIESLTGPMEVWWLNQFASEAERQQVVADYESRADLVAALGGIAERREPLTEPPIDVLTKPRPDLSRGISWTPAGARFAVVSVTRGNSPLPGAVFEAPDGTRYTLRAVTTREQGAALATEGGSEARVFAVRPQWGMPEQSWIAANPEFWGVNPMATAKW